LTTFTGYAVHAWNLESQVVLHRSKEAGNLPWREAHRLDVVPGQNPADVIKGHADRRKEGIAILPENGPEELQHIM
jgi:hypothetical protein